MRGATGASAAGLADLAPPPPARRRNWADLRLRSVSALALGPLVLAVIWLGGPVFYAVVAAAGIGLACEWSGMASAGHWRGESRVLGIAAIAVWAVAAAWLRADPVAGRANVMGLVFVVWGSDIGAYIAGRSIGGPRLAPRVSPGKTWAGAIGGALFAALIALGAAKVLVNNASLPAALAIGAGLSVCGQLGDLAESIAKRRAGVKDSGWLIPGHGGLFDRLDAMMAAVPAAALLSLAFGRGVVLW